MSYDLRIGVKIEDTDIIAVIDEPDRNSPTYNIGEMLRKCMDWDFKQGEWYRVEAVFPNIERGIRELSINRKAYTQYDAPNGWGCTSTALEALKSLRDCIKDIISGDRGWQAVPEKYLYVCW